MNQTENKPSGPIVLEREPGTYHTFSFAGYYDQMCGFK